MKILAVSCYWPAANFLLDRCCHSWKSIFCKVWSHIYNIYLYTYGQVLHIFVQRRSHCSAVLELIGIYLIAIEWIYKTRTIQNFEQITSLEDLEIIQLQTITFKGITYELYLESRLCAVFFPLNSGKKERRVEQAYYSLGTKAIVVLVISILYLRVSSTVYIRWCKCQIETKCVFIATQRLYFIRLTIG